MMSRASIVLLFCAASLAAPPSFAARPCGSLTSVPQRTVKIEDDAVVLFHAVVA